MKEIKIEKGVPLSQNRGRRKGDPSYPFGKMNIGDSFFVKPINGRTLESFQSQLLSNARSFRLYHNKEWKFTSARENDGVRIWRIK